MHALVATFLAVALSGQPWEPGRQTPRPPDPFVRSSVAPGVDLWVWSLPAARQSAFVLLDTGFFDEPAGVPQGAHLAEHLALRCTDRDGLVVDGVQLNGETLGSVLRLEALGMPEAWPRIVERIPRWLRAAKVEREVLAVERGRIAQEVASTAPAGHTGKWARAAWTQVVRHGAREVELLGGPAVDDAALAEELLGRHVRAPRPCRVVVVGPRSASDVREDLMRAFAASVESGAVGESSPPPRVVANDPPAPPAGHFEAVWDLPHAHVVEWYPLAGADPEAVGSRGELLASLLQASLARGAIVRPGTFVEVTIERPFRAGAWLWISFAPRDELTRQELRSALERSLDWARGTPGAKLLTQARASAPDAAVPDFDDLRRRLAGNPAADFLEAQVALNLALSELRTGMSLPGQQSARAALRADAFEVWLRECLAPARRGTLWLRPRD